MNKTIKNITLALFMAGLGTAALPAGAQETRAERVKVLEQLKRSDSLVTSTTQSALMLPRALEKLELPPLSVFLDAVVENATVKRAQSEVEEIKNEYRIQRRDWWNFFSVNGSYTYGRYNLLADNSDEFTPIDQSAMTSTQHNFYIGASMRIPFGDIINRRLKLKKHRYDIEQLQYTQEEVMEERRLKVLEAYNEVTEQLATIKAKSESAALYNAQMQISENDFVQGKIDIITLSLERARRSAAVVNYEQARVQLHNSIILLEMLTNVKIIKD